MSNPDATNTPSDRLTAVALRKFGDEVAYMSTEAEIDGGGDDEDHRATLNHLILKARKITGIDPAYPKVYCTLCGVNFTECDCDPASADQAYYPRPTWDATST